MSSRLSTPLAGALARFALAMSAVCAAPPGASAQQSFEPLPEAEVLENGISIQAHVNVTYQPAYTGGVTMRQNSFAAGAMGQNATSEYVFEILNQAALAELNQALAQGAISGRVTVVAIGCEIGVSGSAIRDWSPVGVFINTTDMDVGENGVANFHTRIQFIPDGSREWNQPFQEFDPQEEQEADR